MTWLERVRQWLFTRCEWVEVDTGECFNCKGTGIEPDGRPCKWACRDGHIIDRQWLPKL